MATAHLHRLVLLVVRLLHIDIILSGLLL